MNDIDSPDYNRWVRGAPAAAVEKMRRDDDLYKYGIVVEYNTDPVVKGLGSAIFFHVWKAAGVPTEGCVSMSEEAMLLVLGWLDASAKPAVLMGTVADVGRDRTGASPAKETPLLFHLFILKRHDRRRSGHYNPPIISATRGPHLQGVPFFRYFPRPLPHPLPQLRIVAQPLDCLAPPVEIAPKKPLAPSSTISFETPNGCDMDGRPDAAYWISFSPHLPRDQASSLAGMTPASKPRTSFFPLLRSTPRTRPARVRSPAACRPRP